MLFIVGAGLFPDIIMEPFLQLMFRVNNVAKEKLHSRHTLHLMI